MNDEEYEFFIKQCEAYGFSQSEMIRTSLDRLVIKPVIKFSPVNKELLSKIDELIAEGKRIGNNLNQIARALNSDSFDAGIVDAIKKALGDLAEWICIKHFPCHQALVCTHPDGHNKSGNIHVHIVINSLRVEQVPRLPYMDKDCDMLPGMKHRCTAAALRYLRAEVMEMCQQEELYQIDLLNGSKERITEKEYRAQRQGQKKLDAENAKLIANGEKPKQTKFETDKAILRRQIRAALAKAQTLDQFIDILLNDYGIKLKESRGRYSYLTPDGARLITSRKLGMTFQKMRSSPHWRKMPRVL